MKNCSNPKCTCENCTCGDNCTCDGTTCNCPKENALQSDNNI